MWHSRMFWQLFGTYGVLIVLSVGLLGFVVGSQAERAELAAAEESLKVKALLLQEAIRGRDLEAAREFLSRLQNLSDELPTRITFLGSDGQVVAGSSPEASEATNQADRSEIQQATALGFGKAVRRNAATGQDTMFVALRMQGATNEQPAPVGFVRVALPLAGTDTPLYELFMNCLPP